MNELEFDRAKLSTRENEILDLATDGLTDAQIAIRLGIAQSTVNSYWVRIRGKLGHLSRTELVASSLRAQAEGRIESISKRSEEFERLLLEREQLASDASNAELYRIALDCMPEAVFVISENLRIRYTNARLESMFGYGKPELLSLKIDNLIPSKRNWSIREAVANLETGPRPIRFGLDQVIYARRRDGLEMRVVVILDYAHSGSGKVLTGIIRNFVDEVDLRRRFAASYAVLT